MADIVLRQDGQLPIATQVRYRDMGDGTYALVSVAVAEGLDGIGNPLIPLIDSDLNAQVFVNEYEYALHESQRFKASFVQPHGGELANDASRDFLVKIGALHAHMRVSLSAGGNCELLIYEEPTTTANGVAVNARSKNRAVLGTRLTAVYRDPTVGAVGTELFHLFTIGGEKKGTGGDWGDTHWIFERDTDYLIRVTNRSGAGIQFGLGLGWSEHS